MRISDKTRIRRGYGTGAFEDFVPYIRTAREVSGTAPCYSMNDFKNGRRMQFLSTYERDWYLVLRWERDEVIDIREQFKMEPERIRRIAEETGMWETGRRNILTTDLLLTVLNSDGRLSYEAYSIKHGREILDRKKNVRRQYMEMKYWESLGVPWRMLEGSAVNRTYADNIRAACACYHRSSVFDRTDLVKYLIANKIVTIDMKSRPLKFGIIAEMMQFDTEILRIQIEENERKKNELSQLTDMLRPLMTEFAPPARYGDVFTEYGGEGK